LTGLRKSKRGKIKGIWTVLRIVVGIGLIVFLLSRLDINKIVTHVRDMDIKFLIYALIPYLFFIIISAFRWQVLLDYKKMDISFSKTVTIYFISLFFNNLLPTTIGGDVMRVVYSMRDKKADALATVLVDRILGFIGLFVFGLLAVLYLYINQKRSEFLPLMIVGLIALILITFLLFSERIYLLFSPVIEKIKILRFGDRVNNLHKTMTDFGGAWEVIILCIVLSIIIQLLLAFAPFLVLRSMRYFEIGILPFFIYVPIINVVSMIPVSLNGLGVRENSYVLLFSRVGLDSETSFAMSLVSFLLVFLYSIIGGMLFILYRKKKE